MLDTVPSCNLVQHKGNMMQPRENGKNPNFRPPKFFSWVSPLLVVRQCPKLSSYATLRKTNGANLKNNKKPNCFTSTSNYTLFQAIIICNLKVN